MNEAEPTEPWTGDWVSLAGEQRQAWLRASADERLRWLEDALTFAYEAGALTRDRDRRAAAARAWANDPHP